MLEKNLNNEMIDHKNYLFILANPGAGGHRLGRGISSLDSVYWYSCGRNGISPTDVYPSNNVIGKTISHNHYDRVVGTQMVPLVGERIEQWWNTDDLDFFYKEVWTSQMIKFSKVLETQYLHWILHDNNPMHLLTRFSNAKIISLIDTDMPAVVNRYLETTSVFPAYYRMVNLRPAYLTQYSQDVETLEQLRPHATLQDLWEYQNPNGIYKQFVKNKLEEDNNQRLKVNHPRHLTVTWDGLNLKTIEDFLQTT